MKCPPGYEVPGKVWHLKRALYGLKQAALAWYEQLKASLQKIGFAVSDADPCLYVKGSGVTRVYVLVHVDDCILIGQKQTVLSVKSQVAQLFEISDLGEMKHFLGMEVIRDEASRTLWLGQRNYAKNVLKRFSMEDCKTKISPMDAGMQLTKDGTALREEVPYRELIGSLLYLAMCTRPDLTHSVGMLSRFMSNPKEEHWQAAKGVLRYLAGTVEIGLKYGPNGELPFGYSDSDFGGETDSRKSTSGNVFIYGGAAVAWASKLQGVVATSTCEAELIAFAMAVKESLHLSKILNVVFGKWTPLLVYGDNQAAITLIRNPAIGAHNRTKHIDIAYHFSRMRVMFGDVKVSYISTEKMVADVMTKQLSGPGFRRHRERMGLITATESG